MLPALRLLDFTTTERIGRLDVVGLALIIGGSASVTYGLAEVGGAGRTTLAATVYVVVGLLLLAAFVTHQLLVASPLLDLPLFRNLVYGAASVTNFCLDAVIFGAIILMPLYFFDQHFDVNVRGTFFTV